MNNITKELISFRDDRNWGKYHTPENLAKSICIEAGELLECFQWGSDWELVDDDRIRHELSDIMIYCLYLAHAQNIDIESAIREKIRINGEKYKAAK